MLADVGRGKALHSLYASGLGLDAGWKAFSLTVDAAWHAKRHAAQGQEREPRTWVRLAWTF